MFFDVISYIIAIVHVPLKCPRRTRTSGSCVTNRNKHLALELPIRGSWNHLEIQQNPNIYQTNDDLVVFSWVFSSSNSGWDYWAIFPNNLYIVIFPKFGFPNSSTLGNLPWHLNLFFICSSDIIRHPADFASKQTCNPSLRHPFSEPKEPQVEGIQISFTL